MPKSVGIVKVKIDGTLLHSKPGASIDPGGSVRNAVESDQPGYFSETRNHSTIECELIVDKDFSMEALRQADDVTATFECDTGQVYVVNHGYVVQAPTITGGNSGGAPITIQGPPAQEMK